MRKFTPFLFLLTAVIAFSFSAKKQQAETLDTNCSFWTLGYGNSAITAWTFADDSTVIFTRSGPEVSGGQSYEGLAYCKIKGQKRLALLVKEDQTKRILYTTPGTPFKIPVAARTQTLADLDGCGEVIYSCSFDASGYSLVRIRDGQLSTVARLKTGERFLAGDIAVDSLGRAWVIVTGTSDNDKTGPHELRCYSHDGRLQATVPVKGISGTGAYGLMTVNGKIYVGFGTGNRQYSDRLVRLDLSGDTLKPGCSIPFAWNAHDLASARPGVPALTPK
jgi:hypothetical protein